MRIALICPSNLLYMPYVDNYLKALKESKVNYVLINWDRFQLNDNLKKFTFSDNVVGHQRGFLHYYNYKRFVIKVLKNEKFDKIIVFGIQLAFFLSSFLKKYYKKKYILDIRDYHKLVHFMSMKEIVQNSVFTTISSLGYKKWLPQSNKYTLNHNTNLHSLNDVEDIEDINFTSKENINISYIGSLTNLGINTMLLDKLQNNNRIYITFHGEGLINKQLINYIEQHNIVNAKVFGRYQRSEEKELFRNADLINMLLLNKNINDQTCMANRVYKSVIYGKPLIALKGSYLSDQIEEYKLGIVLDSVNNIYREILNYLDGFNMEQYRANRVKFMSKVIEDNKLFKSNLNDFIKK